jgi:hypothetical protein
MLDFDPVTNQATISDDLSPEERTVLASDLIISLSPETIGHDEYWRTILLSIPDPFFLQLAHELYEERSASVFLQEKG